MPASPRAQSLTSKQQLFAILSLLLQDMESGLGQFMSDDVVADHLSPTAPMPLQLSFVIAAHLRIAAHRVHGGLRERGFQIMMTVGTENFHVGEARQFAYFIQNSQGDGLAHPRQLQQ